VVGAFIATETEHFGIRGEFAWTDSGEPRDAALSRDSFWRATLGIDKSITPELTFVAELAWNGFGASDPLNYVDVAAADRFLRGETTALARYYAGASLGWQAHPLLAVSIPVIVNLDDGSALLQPNGTWSLSDNSILQFGLLAGLGRDTEPGELPRSEYGAARLTLWAAIKLYF